MAGFELVLIALLPLALLVGFVESRGDDAEEDAAPPEAEEEVAGDLLDMLEPEVPDPPPGDAHAGDSAAGLAAQGVAGLDPAAAGEAAQAEPVLLRAGETLAEGASLGFGTDAPPVGAAEAGPAAAWPDHAAQSPEFEGYLRPGAILGGSGGEAGDGDGDGPGGIAVSGSEGAVVFANGLDGMPAAGTSVVGGAGDDTILGGAGADTLQGGGGDNVIRASYDPNLEIAQGCDLFEWRDNGLPDLLEGGAGDDRLIFARGDTATGGGGSNVFEVWHDPWGSLPAAVVTDFSPGQDRLDLVVRIDEADHPDCGAWDWDRSVQAARFEGATPTIHPDEAAGHTEIRLGEQTLARLLGSPAITAEDIRLFAFWDITT